MQNANDVVFEYLIDQLRQQVNKKDVTSFDVSVRISDLDEVKQVIHNLHQHIAGKDDEIRALKDSLRRRVDGNPYKQQCEDLAHEVLSLKNQSRDMSAQIKELHMALDCAENEVMCLRSIVDLDPKGAIGYIRRANSAMTDTMRRQYLSKALEELGCKDAPEQSGCRKEDARECEHDFVNSEHKYLALVKATGDEEAYKLVPKGGYISGGYISAGQHYVVGEHGPEQSGCRKEDARECFHNWRFVNGKAPAVCVNCGVTKSSECEHEWQFYGVGFPCMCKKCGLKK